MRLDGPIARPPSRYEIAKAAAAARKPVESSSSSSDDKNASSSSDDDAPMRPASRASTAFRPRSPAVSLAVSRASTAKSPQEPLLTLPKELEKPVLDRQRSVRRASVGDADQILSDIASAKAAIASARPQPAYTMPLADFSSTAAASSTRATPVARRRGSESVLSRMDETRLSPPKEDDSDNTSDGYGNDDYSITPTGTAKRTFFKKPGKTVDEPLEIPAVAALPPGPARPASRQTSAFPLARSESDSDSEDQPLAQTRLPSQTPGRPQQTRRTLASTSNPALRVIAASPQTHLPPTAPTTKPTAPAPAPRHTSTTSLSTLASSSSSSSASSTAPARELPAPKSILRRTSFADDLGPATRPSRALVYSASNVPTTRPGMHNARSASTTSIPSPTTSTQFPPRPAFHAHPRSTGSPSSSSASGRTTGESSSGRTPLTPRESMDVELPKHGLGLGPRKMSSAALAAEEEDAPDEVELERRRNERRRNEAKKAVKVRVSTLIMISNCWADDLCTFFHTTSWETTPTGRLHIPMMKRRKRTTTLQRHPSRLSLSRCPSLKQTPSPSVTLSPSSRQEAAWPATSWTQTPCGPSRCRCRLSRHRCPCRCRWRRWVSRATRACSTRRWYVLLFLLEIVVRRF